MPTEGMFVTAEHARRMLAVGAVTVFELNHSEFVQKTSLLVKSSLSRCIDALPVMSNPHRLLCRHVAASSPC